MKEFKIRIDVLSNDLNTKLDNRPTKDWVNGKLKTYDDQIASCLETVRQNTQKMISIQTDIHNEVCSLNDEVSSTNSKIGLKIDRKDVTKIWDHFQRFAEY